MSILPDDILRAVVAFLPPSDLLVFARCSPRFLEALRAQLKRCLDELFVVAQPNHAFDGIGCKHFPPGGTCYSELNVLFGVADVYYFVEAPKAYDGTPCTIRLRPCYTENLYCENITGLNVATLLRFVSWLQRRRLQLVASGEQGF